jgi:hypothetical protein
MFGCDRQGGEREDLSDADERRPDGHEDDHRPSSVLVHLPQQQVEGHRGEDPGRRLDEVGDDTGADESSVRHQRLGGGGCVARHVDRAGGVVERERRDDGDDQVEKPGDSREAPG